MSTQEQVVNTTSEIAEKASEATTGMADKAKNFWKSTLKESGLVILIIVSMILLVFIVIYIFYVIKKNRLKNVILHSEMIPLHNRDKVPFIVDSGKINTTTVNGQEYSYSLWLFLGSNYDTTSSHKIILQRGNIEETPGMIAPSTTPLIVMDAKTNKMYVGVSTSLVNKSIMLEEVFAKDSSTGKFNSGFLSTYIDYIPLQRWVNVIVVIRDMNMYVYVDGDVYSVSSTSDLTFNERPMIRGTTGTAVIGDKRNTTPGWISHTQFFNYALSSKDVRTVYENGPIRKTWLSVIGLGNYGVRSPIYEIQ